MIVGAALVETCRASITWGTGRGRRCGCDI